MPRPKTHDDALRVKLLDRAGELVAEEGPQGLSLRRLASEVGTSTTAVYSLFGSKPALLSELRADGFRRLGDQLRATAPTGDPIADLVRLGTEYRAFALTQRHLYPIMFGDPGMPGGGPAEDDIAGPVLDPLREAVRAAVATGALPRVPDDMVAGSVWAYAHGMVSFELGRALPDGFEYCRAYERGLRATVTGWAGSPHTAPY
ncbi:TetR/AcrR family transcriptional regulator [Saccharomonospora piscinae]|uniref:TetR/AcrR family transcriptional regulator n=1 Tax=Saccharomonospora piscinae TaxID=687388 RepID=UPI0004647072|nr:TetR/AcrR family transcriptional regulator [Saccharomonospora piscinae]